MHPPAFGLYGVMVGFALRESLTRTVPILTSADRRVERWFGLLLTLRLAVFVIVTIRFYLGAVYFFNEVYLDESRAKLYASKSFGLDYVVGLIHFILFFAWGTSIAVNEWDHAGGSTHFLQLSGTILLYDVVWWFVSLRHSTKDLIKLWTLVNVSTLVVMVAAFFGLVSWVQPMIREEIVLSLLGVVSIVDIAELINQKRYFQGWLRSFVS